MHRPREICDGRARLRVGVGDVQETGDSCLRCEERSGSAGTPQPDCSLPLSWAVTLDKTEALVFQSVGVARLQCSFEGEVSGTQEAC
jgi:hypothetical protein